MILTLSEADVAKVLKYEQLIPAMEKALSAFSAGRVIQPVRNMLTIEEGKRFLGIMPAVAEEGMGAKLWRRIGYLRISYRMRCVWLVMSWQWSSPTRSDAMRPRPDHVSLVLGSRYLGFTSWALGSLEGLSVLFSISRCKTGSLVSSVTCSSTGRFRYAILLARIATNSQPSSPAWHSSSTSLLLRGMSFSASLRYCHPIMSSRPSESTSTRRQKSSVGPCGTLTLR